MLRRVGLAITDVSEERIAPIIKVKRISEDHQQVPTEQPSPVDEF
jgi:hypothetical protein